MSTVTPNPAVLTIARHPKAPTFWFGMGSSPLHSKYVAFVVAPTELEVRERLYDALSEALLFYSRIATTHVESEIDRYDRQFPKF